MNDRKAANAAFYPILLGCLIVSTATTFYGLVPSLSILAYPLTAVIVLFLFGCTLMIHYTRKRTADRVAIIFLVMLFPLLASTASNVNFMYTFYYQRTLARITYESALKKFDTDIEAAKGRMRDDPKFAQAVAFKGEIDQLLVGLRNELTDPNNIGAGSKASGIVAEIKRKLPPLTVLTFPSTRNKTELLSWFNQFKQVVDETVLAAYSDQQREYVQLRDEMGRKYRAYSDAGETLKRGINLGAINDTLENMAADLAGYRNRVNRLLSGNQSWELPEIIDPEAARIGDIVRTWTSVWKEGGAPAALIWFIVISLFIDLAPLFYSLGVTKRPPLGEGYVLNPYTV